MSRLYYAGLADTCRLEAARHFDRAQAWAMLGKPDYAAGSRRKAQRWLDRAAEAAQQASLPPTLQSTIMDLIAQRVTADLEEILITGEPICSRLQHTGN